MLRWNLETSVAARNVGSLPPIAEPKISSPSIRSFLLVAYLRRWRHLDRVNGTILKFGGVLKTNRLQLSVFRIWKHFSFVLSFAWWILGRGVDSQARWYIYPSCIGSPDCFAHGLTMISTDTQLSVLPWATRALFWGWLPRNCTYYMRNRTSKTCNKARN